MEEIKTLKLSKDEILLVQYDSKMRADKIEKLYTYIKSQINEDIQMMFISKDIDITVKDKDWAIKYLTNIIEKLKNK